METIKVKARQIAPEYQEAPGYWRDDEYIAITGNSNFYGKTFPAFDTWMQNAERLAEEYGAIIDGGYTDADITSAIADYLDMAEQSAAEHLTEWKELLDALIDPRGWCWDDEDAICAALELMTGTPYEFKMIRGSSQRDYNGLYCPKSYAAKDIEVITVDYFNMGTDWEITMPDGDRFCWYDPEFAHDLADTAAHICVMLAGCYGDAAYEIDMDVFNGWTRQAVYETVNSKELFAEECAKAGIIYGEQRAA